MSGVWGRKEEKDGGGLPLPPAAYLEGQTALGSCAWVRGRTLPLGPAGRGPGTAVLCEGRHVEHSGVPWGGLVPAAAAPEPDPDLSWLLLDEAPRGQGAQDVLLFKKFLVHF